MINNQIFSKAGKIKVYLAAAVVALTCWQCATVLYTPTQANVPSGSTLDELNQGRQLYSDNCGKCHRLHSPMQYNAQEWQDNLNKMQSKAKITDTQKGLIYKYLVNAPRK